jgi:hypothetical protein
MTEELQKKDQKVKCLMYHLPVMISQFLAGVICGVIALSIIFFFTDFWE